MTFSESVGTSGLYYLTLGLIVALVLVVAMVHATAAQERRRIRAATILVVLHALTMLTSSVLHTCTTRVWRDVELIALIFAGLASVGMASIVVFSVLLPRLRIITPVIMRDVITGVTSVIAVLAIAARSGFDFTSLLTTSAVITAVLGFSLQDTLMNVMAGLSVQIDDSLKVGDWIKVGDLSGKISEIRWRYTAIETRNWETVIVPNSVMTKTQVIVLGRKTGKPQQWRRWVWFNVDFRYAPSDVISVVTKALTGARIENVAEDPPPNCILMDLHDSYGRYAVRYWLTDLLRDDGTDSEVRTRVFFALRRANIPLSIPAFATFQTKETTARKTLKQQQEHDRRLQALKRIELFNRLPLDVLEHLADTLVPAPFAPGEVMTRQGAEAHWLYMIVHGEASMRVANGGPEHEVGRLSDGSFFGEMSLLTGEPRDATIVALTDVDCYRLDRSSAYDLFTQRPEFAEYVAEVMARRRVEATARKDHLDRDAQARQMKAEKVDLLARIRRFFELDDEDDNEPPAAAAAR